MTEYAYFMDTINHTEATDNATKYRVQANDGYLVGVEDELEVIQNTPAAMNVIVGTGEMWIQGVRYVNTAAKTVTVDAADATNPRIDLIIIRLTWAANTCEAVCLKGTAAASPVAPTLTNDASVREIPVASVLVTAGKTSILTADITDVRLGTDCGPAACRMGKQHVNTDGTWDFGSMRAENLADPVGAQDAATKAFAESLAVPSGGIISWSGAVSAIPTGWVFCNGSSSTPDLRGKFIIGAQSDSGGTYDVGDTGGEATHALTSSEIPALVVGTNHAVLAADGTYVTSVAYSGTAGTGHNTLPPYYALAYIMKT